MRQTLLLTYLVATPALASPPPGYALVWSDEFDVPGLPDPSRWAYDTEANATGWYNDELQYYAAARPENARVEGGRLVIAARREALTEEADYGGQAYTSARLITRGLAEWTYGFVEVRARLPCGAGTWPAIWMLGAEGPWPDAGEIDVMEQVGNDPDTVFGTIHTRASAGTSGVGASTEVPDACEAFHDYQVEWTPEALVIGVDGAPFHAYARADHPGDGWPFDGPFYLLLNLAVGGEMAGAVDDAIFPRAFEVDYVRVYQAG